jgi:hypothetical protein
MGIIQYAQERHKEKKESPQSVRGVVKKKEK